MFPQLPVSILNGKIPQQYCVRYHLCFLFMNDTAYGSILHKHFLKVTYVRNFGVLVISSRHCLHCSSCKSAQQLFIETCDLEINSFWQTISSKILLILEDHVLPLH